MRIHRSARTRESTSFLSDTASDAFAKIFRLSLIPTLLLSGWLFWGLFSGKLASTADMSAHDQNVIVATIKQLSTWLSVSLTVTVITAALAFLDTAGLGVLYLILAAFLAYGLQFCLDTLFGAGQKFADGSASRATLAEIRLMAIIIGVPGALLVLRQLFIGIVDSRGRQDLANLSYGKGAQKEERKQPLIGAFAKCWELPFCREGIRVRCPIFHAKTKCWKHRVGCMCEENIILLAHGNAPEKSADLTQGAGFVPIGDLIVSNAQKQQHQITTKIGPRGVRIPTNPHLTEAQKRTRCNNCIIYNEHQRQKYQLFTAPVTLAVPALVYFGFEPLRNGIGYVLAMVDRLIGHLSFNPQGNVTDLAHNVTGDLPVETILIICMTLVLMTWAQRGLEYCIFKIKI